MPKITMLHIYRLMRYLRRQPEWQSLHKTLTRSLTHGTRPRHLLRAVKDLIPPHILEKILRGTRSIC